jgi:hypothetical protein
MPRYVWDEATASLVKISDKVPARSVHYVEKPLCEQVREGYKRIEQRGQRVHGNAAGIKRIWGI